MCGIAGFWDTRMARAQIRETAGHMGQRLAHRGPDAQGTWIEERAGVAFAHRRLSILDLSPAGSQPMTSASGRFVLSFNGEVYNHLELREALGTPAPWRGHSDTETLLAGFEAWGVQATLARATGMFALSVWDAAERALCLARDRLGEKPLYYGWQGSALLFGSELKALRRHPAFVGEVNRDAIAAFLRHNYIPAPYSIYRGIYKLLPGTLLKLEEVKLEPGQLPTPIPYWSLAAAVEAGAREPFTGTDDEAIAELEVLLKRATAMQMVADVPLGAFLSGGVDSSTIVALMQTQSPRPVKTFTIGFTEEEYNEARHAKAVAQHLGTEHTELYVTPAEAMDVIPSLPRLYDEPFSDSSQIPTALVSRLARQSVTVSLSGDAGDELFGGYERYARASSIWQGIGWLPKGPRRLAARALHAVSVDTWNAMLAPFGKLSGRARDAITGDRVHKLAEIVASPGPDQFYREFVSHWKRPAEVVIGAIEPQTVLTNGHAEPAFRTFRERMMYLDALSYLPDDILVKVDRAAMAVSLETRVPLLDQHVVEFAWRLPSRFKVRDSQSKWILRQLLYRYVPKDLVERPKMGFGVPIDSWLRGPLRDWAESLLSETRLAREGFLRSGPIRQKWQEHLSGQRNWHYYLWDVLMFQAWLEEQTRHDTVGR